MKVEKVHDHIRYTLSNENLQKGDKVYPIASGRCLDDGGWILHSITFDDAMTGFPDEPHTIEDMKYSDTKAYEIRTDYGYGPIEKYYKIIKREKHVKESDAMFALWNWIEIID